MARFRSTHRTYERVGDERLSDLCPACPACHAQYDGAREIERKHLEGTRTELQRRRQAAAGANRASTVRFIDRQLQCVAKKLSKLKPAPPAKTLAERNSQVERLNRHEAHARGYAKQSEKDRAKGKSGRLAELAAERAQRRYERELHNPGESPAGRGARPLSA